MNNIFDKFKISDEEMEELTKKWEEKTKEEEEEMSFFIKERQDHVMELVYQHLKINGLVSGENILYLPQNYAFSEDYFNKLFYNLSDYGTELNKIGNDEDCIFPNEIWYLKYKDLNIEMQTMSGQGTVMWMNVARDWKEELSFTYEEYKKSL